MQQTYFLLLSCLSLGSLAATTAQAQTNCLATSTLDFGSAPYTASPYTGNWKSHAAVAAPAGSTLTTLSSGSYTSADANSTLQTASTLNDVQSMVWATDYATGTTQTSTVRLVFSRAVTNLHLRIQDIDRGSGFIDRVTFEGSSGSAAVTPTLTYLGTNSTAANPPVNLQGNVATGTTSVTDNTQGTVEATYPSPVTTVTLTYQNISTTPDPSPNAVGIEVLSWCRLAPAARDVAAGPLPSTAGQLSLPGLSAVADGGSIASYTVQSLPAASQGVLYYNSARTAYAAVVAGQQLSPAQAATLRFDPAEGASSTATFAYLATDEAGQPSASAATYTLAISNTACTTASARLDFTTRPNGEGWKNHAALAVPTGSTLTTLSSGSYTSADANSTFEIGALNSSNTLAWVTNYSGTSARTSSVTFTFSRAVSNFALQIQDIDLGTSGLLSDVLGTVTSTGPWQDQVTVQGASGSTTVVPALGPASPNACTVSFSGNVATGTTNVTNGIDGTILAVFPAPITSFTLTFRNIATPEGLLGALGGNVVGLDLASWCRLAPVPSALTSQSIPNAAGPTAIPALEAAADGSIASFTLATLPPASQGVLYVAGVPATAGQQLTVAQAARLAFAPAATFSGPASFSYGATDEAGVASAGPATYTIPVTATGAAGAPAACSPTTGRDGSPTALAGVINTYYPGQGTAAAGATSLTLGAASGAGTPIAPGDLLLIIQMQGADLNTTNTSAYGSGGSTGQGYQATSNLVAGQYEYATAQSGVVNGRLTLASGLLHGYAAAAATATTGRRSFQVVRIPQYATATLGGQLDAAAWDGSTGGILVFDVAGQLSLGGQTLNAAGRGFRGGGGVLGGGASNLARTDYRSPNASAANGSKGEGLAGTPRYTAVSPAAVLDNAGNPTLFGSNVVDGYPGGDNGKGAPGNAGGGATDDDPSSNGLNSGGAGGGNGGRGGLGGWPRAGSSAIDTANHALGGAAFAEATSARLVLGGGGGAGSNNNGTGNGQQGSGTSGRYSSGAPGGGIIVVRAGSVAGTGSANASGAGGWLLDASGTSANDGAGGGGAGGSVLLTARVPDGLAGLTVLAQGGAGNRNRNPADVAHGAGGGGGGGVVFANGTLAGASSVAGGLPGTIASSDAYSGTFYGGKQGTPGMLNTSISHSVAGSSAGSACVADVAVALTGPASATAGREAGPYTATFSNQGGTAASSVARQTTLPAGAMLSPTQRQDLMTRYGLTPASFSTTGPNQQTVIDFGQAPSLPSGNSQAFTFSFLAPNQPGSMATSGTTATPDSEGGLTDNNTALLRTTVNAAGPLPVELTQFVAQAVGNRDAQLHWTTASELHCDRFEVERSLDGVRFNKVGQVAGQGSKASRTDYAYTDAGAGAAQPIGQPLYYRLRQVDADGTSTYSPVRAVSFAGSALSLVLYPNPATISTTLDLSALPATATYQVLLLDATGRQVSQLLLPGGQPAELLLTGLPAGSYQVLLTGQQPGGQPLRQVLRLSKQ